MPYIYEKNLARFWQGVNQDLGRILLQILLAVFMQNSYDLILQARKLRIHAGYMSLNCYRSDKTTWYVKAI